MELSNTLPTAQQSNQPLVHKLHLSLDGPNMRLSLQLSDDTSLEATCEYASPLEERDAADTRWLLEDHPQLRGRSADPIAANIEQRLNDLGRELRRAVFESDEATKPICEALADPAILSQLHVFIEEKDANSWTPWELMLTPSIDQPLSLLTVSFSRYSPTFSSHNQSDTLRVLLITSRPSGEDDVPFRSVASRIVQAVAASEASIQVDVLRPPTYPKLIEALSAASEANEPYNVVHFDGHGSYEADLLDPDRKRSFLYFESADGTLEEVSGPILGADLAQYGVRYLLLNACRSAFVDTNSDSGTERSFGTLAAEVRAAGVEGVLAMGFNLYVVTAASLVASTYAALAAGDNLSEAVSHARRDLYFSDTNRTGVFDWLVPIAYCGDSTGERRPKGTIAQLSVGASTTTPTSQGVVDPGADGGPRSDEHAFFGYDEVLLRLDRACVSSHSVELVGLAGVGKSALAGEFARWWVSTTDDVAVVIDVDSFGSFADFIAEFETRLTEAQGQTADGECILVLEGTCDVLNSETWTVDDQTALKDWIAQQIDSGSWLLLTGRAPSGLEVVETIVLTGLDDESRAELATEVGFDLPYALAFPGMLRWSQGVPSVVMQLPLIVDGFDPADRVRARKLLSDLRSGKTELSGPQLGMTLIERSALEFFNVSYLRRAALPFVLHLFQSYIGDHQWELFYQMVAMKGLKLAEEGDLGTILEEEFRPAVRAGLVSRVANGYWLHPLAPIALEPGLAATIQAITSGNPDAVGQVMGATWVSYIQSVSTTIRSLETLQGKGNLGSPRQQRENLTNAVEISLLGAWWGLAFPLLHKLRQVLLAEAREQEWREILEEVFVRLKESPPQPNEMGPESAELHIIRLLAAEAERDGNDDRVRRLRELQVQFSYSEDTTIEPVEPGKGKTIDIGTMRRISSLIKLGDAEAAKNSAESLTLLNEALRLAEESNDLLRLGNVHLSLGRAYLHVTVLYDPAQYEHHAREALKVGERLGPLGGELRVDASVSLGSAIVEQERPKTISDPDRLAEAYDALILGTADGVDAITRGTAHNSLGNLFRIQNDVEAALDEYLAACKAYEEAGNAKGLRGSQTNAAVAFAILGKDEEARTMAHEAGLEGY